MSVVDDHDAPRPSPHPALRGREREMLGLADEVRRLIALTVTCDLPGAEAAAVAGELGRINDRLAATVPPERHARFWAPEEDEAPVSEEGAPAGEGSEPVESAPVLEPAPADGVAGPRGTWDASVLLDSMPYDVVVGRYNPLAPPLAVELRPPRAIATATFGEAYEGAPGWVHGAVIAGAFDIVLTAANHLEAAAGPTTRLELRYLRPTLIAEEARFEAWIEHRRGRRVVSRGQLLQGGVVKVEATGEFATMSARRRHALRHHDNDR